MIEGDARRAALEIPHEVMVIGIGLPETEILAIEAAALIVGYESETADFYAYWLGHLERLTQEQLEMQFRNAHEGKRFR